MSIKCAACGKFIGYAEDFVFEFEPLSEFGPERIAHLHMACDAQAIEAQRAAATKIDAVADESAVGNADAPRGAA